MQLHVWVYLFQFADNIQILGAYSHYFTVDLCIRGFSLTFNTTIMQDSEWAGVPHRFIITGLQQLTLAVLYQLFL